MPTYTQGTVTPTDWYRQARLAEQSAPEMRPHHAFGVELAQKSASLACHHSSLSPACPAKAAGSPAMWPSSTRSREEWRPAWRGSTLRFQGSLA